MANEKNILAFPTLKDKHDILCITGISFLTSLCLVIETAKSISTGCLFKETCVEFNVYFFDARRFGETGWDERGDRETQKFLYVACTYRTKFLNERPTENTNSPL
jgi:hypothetical protein